LLLLLLLFFRQPAQSCRL